MTDNHVSRWGVISRHTAAAEVAERDSAAFDAHMLTVAQARGMNLAFRKQAARPDAIRQRVSDLAPLFHFRSDPLRDVHVASGMRMFAPPYDVSWNTGTGTPLNQDGTPMVLGSDGFSAAGFGFYLTADRHVSVYVMPLGRFTGSWANFGGAPPLHSSGGTGTVVYNEGRLILSREPVMWSVRDPASFTSAKFDVPFADTATPALPDSFGTVPLAPVLVEMLQDQKFLVWFYVWQVNEHVDGKSFLALSQAQVPLIAVNIGPPLFLH